MRIVSLLSSATEMLFALGLGEQVLARAKDADGPYGIETGTEEPVPGLLVAADALAHALDGLRTPLRGLMKSLAARLDDEAEELDTGTRSWAISA